LIAFSQAQLASYKKPRTVEFISQLPKNAYGKILKRELCEQYWKGQQHRI
jgi:acyl-coenzyme A synthetase/AMP-(fatty) acid ligase